MRGRAPIKHDIVSADTLVVDRVISHALDAEASGGVVEAVGVRIKDAVSIAEVVPR